MLLSRMQTANVCTVYSIPIINISTPCKTFDKILFHCNKTTPGTNLEGKSDTF